MRTDTPFLLLGHHRSGTNFLNDVIQLHSRCELLNEPLSMHSDFWLSKDMKIWSELDFDPTVLHRDLAECPEHIEYLLGMRDYLLDAAPGITRGFKETLLFEKLEWLSRFIPNIRIIFLIRDPRAVVSSIFRRKMADIWSYSRVIAPRMPMSINGQHLERTDVVTQAVWSWKERINLTFANITAFDSLVVRIEDLIIDTNASLSKIMGFLGHDIEEQQRTFCHKSHTTTKDGAYSPFRVSSDVLSLWKRTLTYEAIENIEGYLREEMVRFGYFPVSQPLGAFPISPVPPQIAGIEPPFKGSRNGKNT